MVSETYQASSKPPHYMLYDYFLKNLYLRHLPPNVPVMIEAGLYEGRVRRLHWAYFSVWSDWNLWFCSIMAFMASRFSRKTTGIRVSCRACRSLLSVTTLALTKRQAVNPRLSGSGTNAVQTAPTRAVAPATDRHPLSTKR